MSMTAVMAANLRWNSPDMVHSISVPR
jgi:hypothetical protein